jgi:hypothetical protein
MRTRDEKMIERVYMGENITPPLIVWLSARIGQNNPADYVYRPLLLKFMDKLLAFERKQQKSKKPVNRVLSTAPVDIQPTSFPSSSIAKE